jgi:hypothetical protein
MAATLRQPLTQIIESIQDPENPSFYATFYHRKALRAFPYASQASSFAFNPYVPWRFGDGCVSCESRLLSTAKCDSLHHQLGSCSCLPSL